jgi:hypothetical protein
LRIFGDLLDEPNRTFFVNVAAGGSRRGLSGDRHHHRRRPAACGLDRRRLDHGGQRGDGAREPLLSAPSARFVANSDRQRDGPAGPDYGGGGTIVFPPDQPDADWRDRPA